MKLKTNEVKKFLSMATPIRQNSIMPILSYIRFENGVVAKNNLEQFVEMKADFKGECLIDEKVLSTFVSICREDEIEVKISEKDVTLIAGKDKIKSPTDYVKDFPFLSFEKSDEILFDEKLLSAIKTAAAFTIERDNMPFTSCVFIGNGLLGASTGFIAYLESIDKSLPEIILEKAATNAIKNLTECKYSQSGNYNLFFSGPFTFGFIKKDTKFINLDLFLKVPDGEKITFFKSDIISFCESCIKVNHGKIIESGFKGNKLSMINADCGITVEKEISETLPDFKFNPGFMGTLLNAIPGEKADIVQATNRLYITGESYTSLIMGLQ